jgi:sugar phosphate permease
MAWPVRYKIIGLLTLGTMINYIDRVNISVAAPDIMHETGWDEARFGVVFSAFLVGYALLQFPGGVTADRWSARKTLALSCLGFSLFTALTPLGQATFFLLLFLRFMVGACESASFPSLASLNSRWVPRGEFGRAQTLSISGASLGQMIAYPTTAWIIETFSWETVFYFNAAIGFLWMALWLSYSTDTPREHRSVSAEELQEIERGLVPKAERVSVSFWSIVKSPSVLLLCLSYMFFGYIVWIFILWFPTYLVEARGFSRMGMGMVGMLPTGASFLGVIAGGVISDYLLKKGFSARTARARFPGLSVGASLPFLLVAVTTASVTLSVILFVCFYFILSLAVSGYWSMPLELNPRLVGAISGVMNTAGNLAGIFGPITAGVIVARTGNWVLPFYVAAACGVVCSLTFVFLVSTKPVAIADLAPAVDSQEAASGRGHRS